ncbi:methyltransferase domain-containing protein [Rossellomorea sp. FS2]|uniref:methyltransferase domain-containing protein n=1 Tax=Rossellomorea sp. FS2 TaxID=3391447 RepID=UPI003A4DD48B
MKMEQWMKQDEAFEGWDFSYITETGRMKSDGLSWSYGSLVLPLMREASTMLDMGTGGGEFLSMLKPFPTRICATEGYPPNVPVAKARLEPLGVDVRAYDSDNDLPFDGGEFDLIINQHESFSAREVRRVIRTGGTFLTQQVGGCDCFELNDAFAVPLNPEFSGWNLEQAVRELESNGFKVIWKREETAGQRFYDIGALQYYLKAIPWQVPGFTVEGFQDKLEEIHRTIEKDGYFHASQHRFVIKAEAI